MNEQPAEAVRDIVRLPFPDRRDAGRALAAALRRRFTDPHGQLTLSRPIVLALPRGGVAVGSEVARDLGAPLDVLVTRKIGHPAQPELGVGAIAEASDPIEPVYDEMLLRELGPPPEVAGMSVILVDDGLATGVTARAALRASRAAHPAWTVLAAPVGSPDSVAALSGEADDLVVLATPRAFRAVGEWYTSFGQLTDADVLQLLSEAASS